MTLNELGNQYLKQSDIVKGRITELRPVLKTLTGDEEQKLRMRLRGLYSMVHDCKLTGAYLKDYYDEEAGKWLM